MCRKQPQEADLSDPAETETRVLIQISKPVRSDRMVEMPVRGEGNPDIHIREKE